MGNQRSTSYNTQHEGVAISGRIGACRRGGAGDGGGGEGEEEQGWERELCHLFSDFVCEIMSRDDVWCSFLLEIHCRENTDPPSWRVQFP